jgi:hypothetical protein
MQLPGRDTIPEQIAADKKPYYIALEAADDADRNGKVDVSSLETLMSDCLARQLVSAHNSATGATDKTEDRTPKFH